MKTKVLFFSLSMLATELVGTACADTVWNKQGTAIEGEVLQDEPGQPLVFRCWHKGEWKNFSIERDVIQKYSVIPGNQADGPGRTERAGDGSAMPATGKEQSDSEASLPAVAAVKKGMHSCEELRPILEAVTPSKKASTREVLVLHLNGPFDAANIYQVGKSISAGVFDVLMDFATERQPAAIVLKIDSGGGRIDQMDRIIERLLEAQVQPLNQRVIAWVNMGGSAAALTSLACKEIVMMPQGRLGAATRTYRDGEAVDPPENAGEQKVEAMRDARRRQIASVTGRPLAIQDAMEKPEYQFWYHPVQGFSLEEQVGEGWESYDTDESKPLALEAQALVDLGIAVGLAKDTKTLLALLKMPSDTVVVDIDLGTKEFQTRLEPARAYASEGRKAVGLFIGRLKKEIDDAQVAIRAAAGIVTANQGYTVNDLRVFRNALAKCQVPVMDRPAREFLEKSDPARLAYYDDRLAMAKRVFNRARQSTEEATRASGIAIGGILEDLRFGLKNLAEIAADWE
jgi:hypothetical protein